MKPQRIKLRVVVAGGALVALGGALFAWKILYLELPLFPSPPQGLWQVDVEIAARSGSDEAFSVQAALPEPSADQLVFGERFSSGQLRLSLKDDARSGRVAVWRGTASGIYELGLGFRVQLDRTAREMPTGPTQPAPDEVLKTWSKASQGFPSEDPSVVALVEEIEDVRTDDTGGWVRTVYGIVRHDVRSGETDDPLLALQIGEGSRAGRERLLATLLRAVGIPSRLVRGLELSEERTRERVWAEAWIDGDWWPLSASGGFFGSLPPDYVRFRPSSDRAVVGTGLESLEYRFRAIQERLSPQEVAALMTPGTGVLGWLSLHRLPAGTQGALRVLLLMPLGALLITLLRNVGGVPGYGTFMPMLIALAMRGTGLSMGLALVGIVLVIGVFGRLLITRLRLLLVPRLSILLSLVVLTVAFLGLLGLDFDDRDYFAGILFPIVILTMLVERFSITLAEEGTGEALIRALWSLAAAITVYPVFRSERLEGLFFSYPELVLAVIGALVWLGGYTGYRLSDLVRFRTVDFGVAR